MPQTKRDGSHRYGLAMQTYVTCFPTAAVTRATQDELRSSSARDVTMGRTAESGEICGRAAGMIQRNLAFWPWHGRCSFSDVPMLSNRVKTMAINPYTVRA